MSSLGLTVFRGLHSGVPFLGVGFVFFSLCLLEAVSMLQDALACSLGACSLGACTLTYRVTDTYCVHCVLGGSVFSPGGSSYWAEACRALGPGGSGLPNSPTLEHPKGPVEKCAWGMWHWWNRHGYDRGIKNSVQRKDPKPFLLCQNKRMKFKAFRQLHLPRFRHL